MNKNVRSRVYLIVLVIAIFVVWKYREQQPKEIYVQGVTMGTIQYNIKYLDTDFSNYKAEIDSLLRDFNQSLSTYIPDSEISVFNREGAIDFKLPYFYDVLNASSEVYNASGGAFDPTLGPLIDAWGFGDGKTLDLDSSRVDSLLSFVGFKKLVYDTTRVSKRIPEIKLNFSAIAKGQAIDVVADWLTSIGIENFMVEIGGEVRASGQNLAGEIWTIAIEVPDEARIGGIFDAVYLEDRGMASSGNYRNFRVLQDGRKVAHTIDPRTGFPKMQTLLSATVFAPSCMLADGFATACMVLGLEESISLIESDPTLEAYLIYADDKGEMVTYLSPGLKGKTVAE
ncbi:FAD:protein FMN transferase [Roseivirga sp. E12]|uniref:FAD:protein FMN transferase n=1 Tax=Roseivirga sp. E12 TaxID=2819237 RepID=UPI001ABBF6A1|nr:FAD:protein FMN transferase [Roseivirga sp. E12]MBO3699333.1 FAD:protein FMN transferase [Roseivirga sp. E12]